MQVEVDVKCMETNPWGSKNLIEQNWLRKFMQVEVDVKCMQTNFGGHDISSVFEIMAPFTNCLQKRPKFPFGPWAIVHGSQKIESAQKIYASRG